MSVLRLEKDTNKVIIGEEKELERDSLICQKVNLMMIDKLTEPIQVMAKIRYNANPVGATILPLNNGNVKVVFDEVVKGVAPGQACVFYIDDKVLGGGIIC